MTLLLGGMVILLAIVAILRRVDVRLVLTVAGLALGLLANSVPAVLQTFLQMLTRESFIVPICSAMGFAYVLRQTGCDQHLVQLLVRPVRRFRVLLVPGTVLVGFLVNIPIVSQTSTAVTVGPVLVPLLRAGGISHVTAGSALLLGASIGGELLNPGAPELQTISARLGIDARECVARVLPLVLIHLAAATLLFWWLSLGEEERYWGAASHGAADTRQEEGEPFRVSYLKAAVPLVPLVLLFVTGPPFELVPVERSWLVGAKEPAELRPDSRLIGVAMLIGVILAALTAGGNAVFSAHAFFEGAGYAYANVISLIVCAATFGTGVQALGLAELLGRLIGTFPELLWPLAAGLPLVFALLCGSGIASTQSLFQFFDGPSRSLMVDPASVGVVVSLGAAAGRTMSPVAAVNLMSSSLTGTSPVELTRRVAPPLLVGTVVVVILRLFSFGL